MSPVVFQEKITSPNTLYAFQQQNSSQNIQLVICAALPFTYRASRWMYLLLQISLLLLAEKSTTNSCYLSDFSSLCRAVRHFILYKTPPSFTFSKQTWHLRIQMQSRFDLSLDPRLKTPTKWVCFISNRCNHKLFLNFSICGFTGSLQITSLLKKECYSK